jgi:hypothetical protein
VVRRATSFRRCFGFRQFQPQDFHVCRAGPALNPLGRVGQNVIERVVMIGTVATAQAIIGRPVYAMSDGASLYRLKYLV